MFEQEIPKEIIDKTTIVNIQDVADFYFFGSDKETYFHRDFITCVPPWEITYMNWNVPDHSYSKECGTTINKGSRNLRISHIILNMRVKDDKRIPFNYMDYTKPQSTVPFENAFSVLKESNEGHEVGWIVSIQTFINSRIISQREYFLEKDGSILTLEKDDDKIFSPAIIVSPDKDKYLIWGQQTLELEKTCLLALNFLNCKNIKINENPMSRQVRRNLERHNKPIYKTYTLEIKMMRDIIKKTASDNHTDIKKALHLCRGHFKTFTEDNPLLGKYTGTYWWEMHARGDKKYGEIEKDYKIKDKI